MPDLQEIYNYGKLLEEKGIKSISPYFIPRNLTNMAAGHVSIASGFQVSYCVPLLQALPRNKRDAIHPKSYATCHSCPKGELKDFLLHLGNTFRSFMTNL